MRTYHFPEVHPPADGPWSDEPDKAQWVDKTTNLDCLIVRSKRSGSLCGYVGVPPGHPWYGVDYHMLDSNVDVHGGLTFAGLCQEGSGDGPGVCHIPEPGRPAGVWWLGFDAAHFSDLCPKLKFFEDNEDPPVYRTFEYVQGEVVRLASQVGAKRGTS